MVMMIMTTSMPCPPKWWRWWFIRHEFDSDNNTQVVTDNGKVRLIDLEYSGPNYAAFDIANLFSEYIIMITMMMTIKQYDCKIEALSIDSVDIPQ